MTGTAGTNVSAVAGRTVSVAAGDQKCGACREEKDALTEMT